MCVCVCVCVCLCTHTSGVEWVRGGVFVCKGVAWC